MMKKSLRVLVLVDWIPEDGLFLNSLRESGLDCDYIGINFPPFQMDTCEQNILSLAQVSVGEHKSF